MVKLAPKGAPQRDTEDLSYIAESLTDFSPFVFDVLWTKPFCFQTMCQYGKIPTF